MTLYTARYATADPDRGVPIQTSIGAPRFVGYPVVKWATVAPWGLLDQDLDEQAFRRAYRRRLHQLTPKVLRELAELQEAYAPLPLLLCCFEDLSKSWCHRTMLGEWISQKTGLEVPEVG